MNNLKKNGGFTLIEILVVIGIIAILATIVLIAINPARQFRQAGNTQRTSNINAILNGIGQFVADNKGTFPTEIDNVAGFQAISSSDANLCDGSTSALVPKYIPALPFDPKAIVVANCVGNSYDTLYLIDKDPTSGRITIRANGENPDTGVLMQIDVTR